MSQLTVTSPGSSKYFPKGLPPYAEGLLDVATKGPHVDQEHLGCESLQPARLARRER